MEGHNIRLILTDIDGTILPYGQRCVSERTRQAFHAAIEAGIQIGPASGRGFSYIPRSFAGDAACSATCLATNGMQIYLDGRLIHQELLPREPIVAIVRELRGFPHAGLLCFEDGMPLLVEGRVRDLRCSFEMYANSCAKADEVPRHDIEKANVFVNGNLRETFEVCAYLSTRVRDIGFNVPMQGFINMAPVGWSKASGIDILCSALGIGLDQVVVFGDGGNDVEMLEHVPHSVAVEDAAPEALAAARHVVGRCADDAVAQAIEVLAAGEWPFGG